MSEYVGVPDGFTPVVGWRAWKLSVYEHTDSVYLHGMQSYWQTDGPTHAFCSGAPRPTTAHSPDGRNVISVPNPNYATEMRVWLSIHGGCSPSEYDPLSGTHVVKSGPVTIAVTRPLDPGVPHVPSEKCSCGLYVASKLEEARKYLYPTLDYASEFGIIGRAALWGTVVEHQDGARGEYGYPQAFYVPDKKFTLAAPKLKAAFNVPVFRMSELPDVTREADEPGPTEPASSRRILHRKLRYIGPAALFGLTTAFAYLALAQFVWGITGETDLRHAIGALTTIFDAAFALYYWNLFRKARVWAAR